MTMVTRRRVIQTATVAASGLAVPFVHRAGAAAGQAPKGSMTLAWHTNIAPRWLDPLQHDGGATPDNFLNVVQDALIKNYKNQTYDHLALADHFEFAEDARSATFRLRDGIKFHDGSPVTPDDVKWSYEHYHGAWAAVLHDRTDKVTIVDKRTYPVRFQGAVPRFSAADGHRQCLRRGLGRAGQLLREGRPGRLCRKADRCGALQDGFAGAGDAARFRGLRGLLRAGSRRKSSRIISVPDPATRVAMLEREEADIVYGIPGELVARIKSNPKLMLAPVVSGNFWLEFPGFEDPKSPFHDKRVREAISLAIDRDAINQAECAGLGRVDGNWINNDVEYGLEWPKWPLRPRQGEAADGGGRPPKRLHL